MSETTQTLIFYAVISLITAGLFFSLWTLHKDIKESTQVQVNVANALIQVLAEGLEVNLEQ